MDKKNDMTGTILHATEALAGSFFEDAVIVVAVHDENGAFGLMLNRRSHMPIQEVFNPVPNVTNMLHPFYIGGPVDEEGLHLLHLTTSFDVRNGLEVYDGVELGGEWDTIEDILQSDPQDTFLFLGYSGWNTGQLEDELAEGSWDVYRVNVRNLLESWDKFASLGRKEMISALNNYIIA